RVERALDAVDGVEVERTGGRQPAPADVVEEVPQPGDDLLDALGAVPRAEEREREERDRGDRRHAVDAGRDLERGPLERGVLLVRVRLRGRIRRTERTRERDGLPEADVDLAVAPAERPGEAEEPPEALALLLRAAFLRGVAGDVLDLVVRDRDRHEEH